MGLVIMKLTHPKSLTHKYYNKEKGWGFFCVGFPRKREREKRDNFFEFLRLFSEKFLTFSDFHSLFLSISLFFPLFFSWFFSKIRGEGLFIGRGGKWEASISVSGYTSASPLFKGVASQC